MLDSAQGQSMPAPGSMRGKCIAGIKTRPPTFKAFVQSFVYLPGPAFFFQRIKFGANYVCDVRIIQFCFRLLITYVYTIYIIVHYFFTSTRT